MGRGQKPGREAKQQRAFNAILGTALVFLGCVLAVNFVSHIRNSAVFRAAISGLGALLFFAVGVILFSDLIRRRRQPPSQDQEEE